MKKLSKLLAIILTFTFIFAGLKPFQSFGQGGTTGTTAIKVSAKKRTTPATDKTASGDISSDVARQIKVDPLVVKKDGDLVKATVTFSGNDSSRNILPGKTLTISWEGTTNAKLLAKNETLPVTYDGRNLGTLTISENKAVLLFGDFVKEYDNINIQIPLNLTADITQSTSQGSQALPLKVGDLEQDITLITNEDLAKKETLSLPVEVKWTDKNHKAIEGPAEGSKVLLYANGEQTKTEASLNKDNKWKSSFADLKKFNDSLIPMDYTVRLSGEEKGTLTLGEEKYTVKVSGNDQEGYVIDSSLANLSNGESIDIKVTKKWEDKNGRAITTPPVDSVKVILYANSKETSNTLSLGKDNNWTGTFTEAPIRDSEGKEILYTIREENQKGNDLVLKGVTYTVNLGGSAQDGLTLTNREKTAASTKDLLVKKFWKDSKGNYMKAPVDTLNISLYKNGVLHGDPVQITAKDSWNYSFKNLPTHEEVTKDGKTELKEINWAVKETGQVEVENKATKKKENRITLRGNVYVVTTTQDANTVTLTNTITSSVATKNVTVNRSSRNTPSTRRRATNSSPANYRRTSRAPQTYVAGSGSYITTIAASMVGLVFLELKRRGK